MSKPLRLCCALLFALQACSDPVPGTPAVFHLAKLDFQQSLPNNAGGNVTLCTEHFVIEPAPRNPAELQKVVQAHSATHEKKKVCENLIRKYYRSHDKLNKNYQEDRGGYFNKDDIESHFEQMLMSATYRNDGSPVEYTMHTNHQAYQELMQGQR